MNKWEEEFNENFGYKFNIGVVPDDTTRENIKQFIKDKMKEMADAILDEIKATYLLNNEESNELIEDIKYEISKKYL